FIQNAVRTWASIIYSEDQQMVEDTVMEAVEQDKPYTIEFRIVNADGIICWVFEKGQGVFDEQGNLQYLDGVIVDITDRKRADEQITFQASHDALTGLVNRREFENRAERLLSTIRQGNDEHALCFMDLDQFKVVNDTCGHAAGDEMLRQLSAVLQETVRHHDTLARLGGDEFGVLIEHCSLDDAHRVVTTLQKAIQDYQFAWEGHSFRVGVSMGLVPITETTTNLTELLKDADAACYMAKDKGRNRIHVYHAEDLDIAQRHGEMQWVTRIQHALEEDKFCLYAQSIVPLDHNTDKHYELLIRMIDDKGEIIQPGAFLPAAERYNLITQIDRWVIENAFRLLAENPAFQSQISFISINLSGPSLAEQNVLDFIITQLDKNGIDCKKICFEITETAAISSLGSAIKFISTLKGLGCRFSLDDFGSGLSSFGYLKNLPVDYLKIDGMFVKDIVDDPIDRAMVKSINEIGQVMGMQTIAEFVENDEIKGMLREIGVNYAQGYGIDKPMPFEDLLARSVNVTDISNPKDNKVES
ncbi:MAG: EAL domain-containing protein, partial [Proteobacteria bacterium]|nr:EAL domain-containing protein [Pseudomonadota bacterium]